METAMISRSPAARSQLPAAIAGLALVEAPVQAAKTSPSPAEGYSYRRQRVQRALAEVSMEMAMISSSPTAKSQLPAAIMGLALVEATTAKAKHHHHRRRGHCHWRSQWSRHRRRLTKNGEKITVSGDATLKVQGGPTDEWDGAGAGIGNGGSHNGDFSGSFTPVNGAETEPDTSNLTTGKIEYYAPGADMTKDEPTSTTLGSGQPASPGETAAPVEYRMQTSASEPVQEMEKAQDKGSRTRTFLSGSRSGRKKT